MSVLTNLKAVYNQLRPVQKLIADYFLAMDFESLNVSIAMVAKETGASIASISRFCKTLGYESFQQFKITLSRDLKYEPDTVLPIFKIDDDPDLSIRKVFSEAVSNLQATEEVVDFGSVRKMAERIIKTKLVYFFGLGGSGKVGTIGEVWFSHIGCHSRAVIDPYEMIVTAGHAHGGYNIITLSHSGYTQPIIEASEKAKSNGAFVACVTNYSDSPLAGLADILLLTACPERRVHFAQSNSVVAQSTIIRSIYMLVASRSKEPVIKRVGNIERDVKNRLR